MIHLKNKLLPIFCSLFFIYSCDKNEVVENIIEQEIIPYCDTLVYDKLDVNSKSFILSLTEQSTELIAKRSFNLKNILQIAPTINSDSIIITSYSAKRLDEVDIFMYVPELQKDILIATLDSIPMFGQVKFRPKFLDESTVYNIGNGELVVLYKEFIHGDMRLSVDSKCKHYLMLKSIKTDWDISFSNYSWKEGESTSWLELRSMVAREWVVIVTNFGYMMSSPEYKEIMNNFSKVFGGDLCNNNKVSFTNSDYNNFIERCFLKKRLVLGRVNPAYAGGLGGGSTFGVADWNFYGHYASYSGWDAIAHELAHCYGFSHDSNMTYPSAGIGWTPFIANFHVYMATKGNLPYESRNILDTHNPIYDEYRGFGIDKSKMNDASTAKMYKDSKVRKYFENEL